MKRSEAEYLLRQLNRYLSRPYAIEDIVGGFAGVRPLVSQGKAGKTKKLIREHEVEVDRESGLISVLGGKWTTYRAMAEDAINAVQQQLGLASGLDASRASTISAAQRDTANEYPQLWSAKYGVSEPTARHLSEKFGTNAEAVLQLTGQQPELAQSIVAGYPAIRAEIAYSARNEMAATLDDVLERRTGAAVLQLEDRHGGGARRRRRDAARNGMELGPHAARGGRLCQDCFRLDGEDCCGEVRDEGVEPSSWPEIHS